MLTSTVKGVKWDEESRVATMPHSQCLSKAISCCSPTANHCREFWEASRLQQQCYPYGLWLAFELKCLWRRLLGEVMTAIRRLHCLTSWWAWWTWRLRPYRQWSGRSWSWAWRRGWPSRSSPGPQSLGVVAWTPCGGTGQPTPSAAGEAQMMWKSLVTLDLSHRAEDGIEQIGEIGKHVIHSQ